MIAINTHPLKQQDIVHFNRLFSQLLGNGQGSKATLSKSLPLQESDGIRLFLGVPDEWLTDERKRIIEGVYAYAFKQPLPLNINIWKKPDGWTIPNPNAISAGHDMNSCMFDFDYIESFGVRLSAIEKEILMADSKPYLNKANNASSLEQLNLRFFTALILFGFSNPYDFFIPR